MYVIAQVILQALEKPLLDSSFGKKSISEEINQALIILQKDTASQMNT
jgi:hypothetical protein